MLNKSENYELALSTTTLIPQGIFNITEVNLLGKSFSSKLPRILKPNSTYASIKPMNSEVLAIEQPRPKSSWNSFLKRKVLPRELLQTVQCVDCNVRRHQTTSEKTSR